jgi:hypothetical protein
MNSVHIAEGVLRGPGSRQMLHAQCKWSPSVGIALLEYDLFLSSVLFPFLPLLRHQTHGVKHLFDRTAETYSFISNNPIS